MNEILDSSECNRATDLVGFLYGEVSEAEARDFEYHLQGCAFCRSELVAFGGIRQSVASWRLESLGSMAINTSPPRIKTSSVISTEPSAVAAIRAFFNLSPLWMKGAVAFASLLFCLFAVLAIGRLGENSPSPALRTESPAPALVEVASTENEPATKDEEKFSAEGVRVANEPNVRNEVKRVARNKPSARPREGVAFDDDSKTQRRPLTKEEREQLAADLRLISENDDPDLDLLGDRLNRD